MNSQHLAQGTNLSGARLRAEHESSVMVVEDDTALRLVLSEALRSAGLDVIPAADGVEAVELYRENASVVWLVVADILMPRMDGLTAASEIRKIDDDVFFIFMSGYDLEQIGRIEIRMEDIPRSEFLRKPFAFKDMVNRIRTLDRQRKGLELAT
jgi:two-component system, cell cycle sensor histidine kinase and response regulator CckA